MDFSKIKDIKTRQLAFLDDTAAFYNLGNRATIPISGGYKVERCRYGPTKNSPGCAIGRHLPTRLAEEMNYYGDLMSIHFYREQIYDNIPEWMREMGASFLFRVQGLHDNPLFWDATGLSETGRKELEAIKAEYLL